MSILKVCILWLVSLLVSTGAMAMVCVDQLRNQAFQIDEFNGYTFQIGFPQNAGQAFREPTGQFYMRLPARNPMVEAYFAAWNGQLILLNVYQPGPVVIGYCQQQVAMPPPPRFTVPNMPPSRYQVVGAPRGASPIPAPFAPSEPGYIKPAYASEDEMRECVRSTGGERDEFMDCAARKMFSPQQVRVYDCVAKSNDQNERAQCLAGTLLGSNERRALSQVQHCYEQSNGNWQQLPLCMAGQQYDPSVQKAIGCIQEQARSGGVTAWGTVACVGGSQLRMNPEMTVAVQCAATTGGDPMSWAACTGGQMTAAELEKCISNGVGGSDGCFGPNNTIVQALNQLGAIVQQQFGQNNDIVRTYNNAVNDIVHGPGPSNDLVRAANTVANDMSHGAGPNNDIRKTVNNIFPGIW